MVRWGASQVAFGPSRLSSVDCTRPVAGPEHGHGTGTKGTKGLGGPAVDDELNQPHGVTVDPEGILYISDSSNNRILKIVP